MNYLAMEKALTARIEALDVARSVLTVQDFLAAVPGDDKLPAVLVAYDGESIAAVGEGTPRAGRAVAARSYTVVQRWAVAVVTRNIRNSRAGDTAREQAGEVLSRLILGLSGWTPNGEIWQPLVRGDASAPFYEGGKFFYPLGFSTRMEVTPDLLARPDAELFDQGD